MKHRSPKALRKQKKRQWGIVVGTGLPLTVAGTLNFGPAAAITFASDPNTGMGFKAGDKIMISGQSEGRSNRAFGGYDESVYINHKKVHVARRRQSKGKTKPIIYEIDNVSATTITVKAGTGLTGGGTITSASGSHSISYA